MAYPLAMRPRNRLRVLRKAAGLTQAELAAATGVTQSAISQIENDVLAMDVAWMRAFARELGCQTADLLDEADNPDRLTDEERQLIHSFRQAGHEQREMISRVAEPLAPYAPQPAEPEPLRKRA
jgi:transcriptional regulator with XRE-family HTH domain